MARFDFLTSIAATKKSTTSQEPNSLRSKDEAIPCSVLKTLRKKLKHSTETSSKNVQVDNWQWSSIPTEFRPISSDAQALKGEFERVPYLTQRDLAMFRATQQATSNKSNPSKKPDLFTRITTYTQRRHSDPPTASPKMVDEDLFMRFELACALPPDYFERPPAYANTAQNISQVRYQPSRPQTTVWYPSSSAVIPLASRYNDVPILSIPQPRRRPGLRYSEEQIPIPREDLTPISPMNIQDTQVMTYESFPPVASIKPRSFILESIHASGPVSP